MRVKGQDEVLSGGLETSTWADSRNPCWWPGDLVVGSGQGFDSLAGEGLLKAVRVALGGYQVGVLGMMVSKPDGWMLLVTAIERRS